MKSAWRLITVATLLCCWRGVLIAGEISDHRQADHPDPNPPEQSRSDNRLAATDQGVTEMVLARTPCYGMCPAYSVVIKNDGTFSYNGENNVLRIGKYTGTVNTGEFYHLAQFIKDSGYMDLQDSYSIPITDNPTVLTSVVMNGKRKRVSDYANAGPTKLWAIEQLIDKLLLEANWDDNKAAAK